MNALQKFEIPATWNCKRETANCRLRFPMKKLMLKVFNHSQNHMLAVFDPTKCWKNYNIPSRQASWANNLNKQIGRQGRNSKKYLFAHLQGCHQYISRRMQHHICPIKIVPSDPHWTQSQIIAQPSSVLLLILNCELLDSLWGILRLLPTQWFFRKNPVKRHSQLLGFNT